MADVIRSVAIMVKQDIQPNREGEAEIVLLYGMREFPTGIKAPTPEQAIELLAHSLASPGR